MKLEKIFLRDKIINYCTGCSTCSRYNKPCPQKDDTAEIFGKNDKGRCDSNGNSGLFLHDECSNEDFDRPLLRTLYRNG